MRSHRYAPRALRASAAYTERRDALLAALTHAIHAELVHRGQTLVDHSPYGATAYFRIIIAAPVVQPTDLARVLDDIAAIGQPLWPALTM